MEQTRGDAVADQRTRAASAVSRHRRARAVVGLAVVSTVAVVASAAAAVTVLRRGAADVSIASSPLLVHRYDSAILTGWTAATGFPDVPENGPLVDDVDGLTTTPADAASLPAGLGPLAVADDSPWFDEAWSTRLCTTLDTTAPPAAGDPTAEPIRGWAEPFALDVDALVASGLLRPDLFDLRAAVDDGTGLSTETSLWVEPAPVDGEADTVWVRVPELPAAGTVDACVYVSNPDAAAPVATLRGEAAVFDGGSVAGDGAGGGVAERATARFVALDPDLATLDPVGDPVDGVGPLTVALAAADGTITTVDDVVRGSLVTTTGTASARYVPVATGDGIPTGDLALVPVSSASTTHTVAVSEAGDRVAVAAPFGSAEVTITRDGVTLATVTVAAPVEGEPLPVEVWTDPGPAEPGGASTLEITATRPVVVDHDRAALTPSSSAGERFVVPIDADAVEITCATPTVEIDVVAPLDADPTAVSVSTPCGDDPGALGPITRVVEGPIAAGSEVAVTATTQGAAIRLAVTVDGATAPLASASDARPSRWPEPERSGLVAEGLLDETSTWTAPAIATSGGLVGSLQAEAIVPADTAVRIRVGNGIDPAVGPDGTPATAFELVPDPGSPGSVLLDQPLPPALDGAAALVADVELVSDDRRSAPIVRSITIGHDLVATAPSDVAALTSGATVTADAGVALRVSLTADATATTIRLIGPAGWGLVALDGSPIDETTDGATAVAVGPGSTLAVVGGTTTGPLQLLADHGTGGPTAVRFFEVTP
ncbi:MAG: hypothetical protein ACRBI6_14495 [Acidimicrobiales bacterium]